VPVANGVITALLASFGEPAVAAFGVGSRIEFLANSLIFAVAASIGPFVGQNMGRGRIDRVKEGVRLSNWFAFLWGLTAWGVLALLAGPIAGVFNNNAEVIDSVKLYLYIVPAGFGLQGVLSVINSHLNTINKPLQASLIIVVQMLVLGLPAIYLGRQLLQIPGIFIGVALTYITGGLISLALNQRFMTKLSA